MKNQSFEALKSFAISKSRMQGRETKRNMIWSILEDSHCQPLLENFLDLNSCIQYVVLKLGKLAIQCFKWCAIQSWNEGVTTIGSQPLKAKGQFRRVTKSRGGLRNQPLAAKWCPSCCEISQPSCTAAKFSWASRYLRLTFFRFFALDIWCLNPQTLLVIHLS